MEFTTQSYNKKVNEDVQSSLSDADLLTKAAELEAKKIDAKKKVDDATKNYNDICQQVDQQMVQLLHTQAQRNGQAAKSKETTKVQENETLNEETSQEFHRVLLDTFLPQLLGVAYNDKLIMKLCNNAGLRCYNDPNNGLTVVLTNPGDLEILFQVLEDNYLEPKEYEDPILEQLPGQFTRAFYSGDWE